MVFGFLECFCSAERVGMGISGEKVLICCGFAGLSVQWVFAEESGVLLFF